MRVGDEEILIPAYWGGHNIRSDQLCFQDNRFFSQAALSSHELVPSGTPQTTRVVSLHFLQQAARERKGAVAEGRAEHGVLGGVQADARDGDPARGEVRRGVAALRVAIELGGPQ